jgi:hypothetical protein
MTQTAGRRPDILAVAGLLVLTMAVEAPLLVGGTALALDGITQFVPWYAWLGERLRAGALPGWNPHTFAGMPFAGAPLSGWGYLPAMVLFTLLPVHLATPAYLLTTLALAGTGMYALARALRMPIAGALTAAVAFEFSGYVFLANPCCFAYAQVEAWLPWTLLGALIATRATDWGGRLRGWALSGLALSQVLVAWFGQGSLYVLLALGAWLVWCTVVTPQQPARTAVRVGRLALHGGAMIALGTALGAAGLLPRLEFNAVSTLAGGYPASEAGQAAAVGGWRMGDFAQLLRPGIWYAGVVPLALASTAPLVAWRRHATPFFVILAAVAAVLALAHQTPLHDALAALPVAGRLHPHSPERVLLVAYPAVALLAGATVSSVAHTPRGAGIAVVALITVAGDLLLGLHTGVAGLREARRAERLVDVDLAAAFDPGPAGAWLQVHGADTGRYFGYAPQIVDGRARTWAYSVRWADPQIAALLENNQALGAGLSDIQGYDPAHIARYDHVITALNGRRQDYHFADVRPEGLFSPLLDMLNVRWVLVPSRSARDPQPGDPARIAALAARLPTVYDDGTVRILARPTALPRAWFVHDARREPEPLRLLASGAVDPATTVLLEVDPPPLGQPTNPARDQARIVAYEPERIRVETTSDADALLVLSEIAYPAWTATVDGEPATLLVANHALRAVPVPAGTHTVELRFRSVALATGTALSAVTALGLAIALMTRKP